MGLIVGLFKFLIGLVVGAATGGAVATFIVTRDGQETVEKLRGVMSEMVESAKVASAEEEERMRQRRLALIGDAAEQRVVKSAEQKAVEKAKKELKKEYDKKYKGK
jgi:hypothetical protein